MDNPASHLSIRKNTLKIGDSVISPYGISNISNITLTEKSGNKYGLEVDEVYINLLDRTVVDLDDGHWVYGKQLDWIPY